MIIRKACEKDLERCLEIYEIARQKMRENKNPTQWGESYPYQNLLEEDIKLGRLYVAEFDGNIEGVFLSESGPDDTYIKIDGKWLNNEPYYVIHRIASSGRVKGVLKSAVDFTLKFCKNIKIDTHENNKPMQKALSKLGFVYCGTIYVFADWEGISPRMAYHLSV